MLESYDRGMWLPVIAVKTLCIGARLGRKILAIVEMWARQLGLTFYYILPYITYLDPLSLTMFGRGKQYINTRLSFMLFDLDINR